VAIGVLWPAGERCALAHCLLPHAGGSLLRVGARYVDQAVPSLLALLGVEEADKPGLRIVLAGGASLLGPARVATMVGRENIAAAGAALLAHGLAPAYTETGGRRGRRIHIDSRSYTFEVVPVERYSRELDHAVT
jgi:chemotaxis protein CheD